MVDTSSTTAELETTPTCNDSRWLANAGIHIRRSMLLLVAIGVCMAPALQGAQTPTTAEARSRTLAVPTAGSSSPATSTVANASQIDVIGSEAESQKQLGDQYVAEDAIEEAAAAYRQSLLLDRDRFSHNERVDMTIYISWADRLEEASEELQFVLSEDPEHLAARVHLARVYSWSGQLDQAIFEADRILQDVPGQRDALLIKADALQWQGRYGEAIELYSGIVETDSDFDAEIGLASALLYKGDPAGANRRAQFLEAGNPRQERDLEALSEAIRDQTAPRFDVRYNVYSDSDDNTLAMQSATYGFSLGNQRFRLNLGRTENLASPRGTLANDFSFETDLNPSGVVGVSGGFGFSRVRSASTATLPKGHFRIEGRLPSSAIGVTVTSEMLNETVELTNNRVRRTVAGVDVTHQPHQRLGLAAAYNYMDFSDGNHANVLQLGSEFEATAFPRWAFGYRFRLMDFDRQSRSGFFDPQDFRSHRVFTSLYADLSRIYTYLEVYAGNQSFTRSGFPSSDWIAGGAASIGFNLVSTLVLELNVEAGDFAAGSVTGFRYFNVGSRLAYRF